MKRNMRATILIFMLATLLSATFYGSTVLASESNSEGEETTCETNRQDCQEYGVALDEILAYPEPDVTPLVYNTDLMYDRYYQQASGKIDIHDAPNGNHVSSIEAGFNFFTTIDAQDGWTAIAPNQWIRSDKLTPTNYVISKFTGVLLPDEPLPYTMAWMLVNVYPATEPGGSPNETENALVPRYSRVNIYDTVIIDDWRWYQIGAKQWVHQTQVGKSLPIEKPEDVDTERWVSVDLYEQTLVAYEGDKPVFTTLIASGLPRWPTREGVYHIYWRRVREDMTWGKPGDDFYYLEEVPWTMFFDEGRALHGAYWHDGFGYRRSHGCVNMSITDAHWLYQWVAETMGSRASADREEGPAVYVFSSGAYVN